MTERDQVRQAHRGTFLPMIQSQSVEKDDDQVPSTGLLVDRFGRRIRNLRISVTDKCNFRCTYCMPAEGLPWLKKAEILSYEEITRIARIAVRLGIEQIRLTGGEPLVRRDQMERVLEGLEEVERYPSIRPIKINAVAIRAFSEEEVLALVHFARSKAYIMRWIEFMLLDADQRWRKEEILTGGEIKSIIEAVYGPLVLVPADPSETARRYTFADGIGEVGFINPVSEPFCATCDRIRLTADGQLCTCLFATTETDLRAALRSGSDDERVAQVLRRAVWYKELKHYIGDTRFKRANRSMSMIGG